MPAKVDTSRLMDAIRKMQDIPKKEGPAILNKSVLQVVIGSGGNKGLVQLTKKATEAQIKTDLSQMVTTVGKRGGTKSTPRVIALAAQALVKKGIRPRSWSQEDQLLWRSQVSDMADRIIKARVKSRAFMAAGWLFAAADMAQKAGNQNLRISKNKSIELKSNGEAKDSFAKAAKAGTPIAGAYNTATGAEKICTPGVLQLAINGETNNIRKYLTEGFKSAIKKSARIKVLN